MFFAELSHFLEDARGAVIVCPIPDKIHYHQLREYFRVPLPPDLKGTIQLFESGNEALAEGTLLDLSIGGVGAMVKSSVTIEVGHLYPRCKIMLPPLLPGLQMGLEIRRSTPEQGGFRIGGRFVGLSGANLRQLERTVAELERILLKRNWRA
jgi:c-di-GMP-binding flagellar brake protein YcgR